MNLNEQDMTLNEYTTSCIIQPVKQKVFQFNLRGFQSINLHNRHHNQNNKNWKPVLFSKKLYSEPKFILSLERKKARIISGIRDRQIENRQQKTLGMIGSKVKHNNYKYTPIKVFTNSQFNIQNFVRNNQISLNKTELKAKKNPNMNFSLKYISQRRKNIETQCKTKSPDKQKQVNFRMMTSSFRQKGSDSPYLHMIMSQVSNKKYHSRPRTSCASERYSRRIQRPSSQIQ